MQLPRHPATPLAALGLVLLPACCGALTDSAGDSGGDVEAVAPLDEDAFIAAHVEALCALEVEIEMIEPTETDGYTYSVEEATCLPALSAFYYDVTRGLFLPEVAASCHSAYLLENEPAPYGVLDWRWCFFAWQP